MIKHVIFDLDGVLVDARELHYEALNRALAKFGFNISRSEHLATFDGLPTRRKLDLLTERKGLPKKIHDEIWREKQRQTKLVIKDIFRPDKEQIAMIDRLKEDGLTVSVCSNSVQQTIELMLEKLELLDKIVFFLSNEDVQQAKPHPEIYLRAFLKLGAAPAECLVIEDSHHGRASAYAAGAHLCGVAGPSEVSYERIRESINVANGTAAKRRFIPKWQGRGLRVVIPMAGEGKSYQRAGYSFPKPLVDIFGKPMVQWVVENMNTEGQFIFIVLRDHYDQYNLKYLLNLIAPGCEIVSLDKPTQGAAVSVLAAKSLFDDEDPLTIVNFTEIKAVVAKPKVAMLL